MSIIIILLNECTEVRNLGATRALILENARAIERARNILGKIVRADRIFYPAG